METILVDKVNEIKKEKDLLEKKLKVKIDIKSKKVSVEGETLDEYEAAIVIDAIGFGFSAKTALLLKEEDVTFKRISIRSFTRRTKIDVIKARLIGTEGRTKRTLEQLADSRIIISGNEIGIIGPADEMDTAMTAITNLIRGSKQSNVYRYLEKINKSRRINE